MNDLSTIKRTSHKKCNVPHIIELIIAQKKIT